MRILIATNTCPPRFVGGAELMAHEQAKALSRLGHDVRIFAGDLGLPGQRHERVDDAYDGVPYHRIALEPEDYSAEYLNFLHPRVDAHFGEVLESFQPAMLHCHNLIGLSVKLPMIAQRRHIRTVCTLHDFWGFCLRNTAIRPSGKACDDITQCRSCLPNLHDGRGLRMPLRYRKDFMRLAFDHIDRFIVPSRHFANQYVRAGFRADLIDVVPNGVDVVRFHPVSRSFDSGSARITYAGYFGAHKGVATLLQAMALIPGEHVTLQLVGDGPEEPAYRKQAEALGIADRVTFFGKRAPADMPAVYDLSDIVVLPSIWDENQPVCLMEAMAAGMPVVASRKGGIPELIDHGRNGLLFRAGDPIDLSAQLTRLIDDPALRRAAGIAGRERVASLGHERQAERLIRLYETVLVRPRETARPLPVIAAIGPDDATMQVDDAVLETDATRGHYVVPREWVADCVEMFGGVFLSGRMGRRLRRWHVPPFLIFPTWLRPVANVVLRWASRHDS